jgi:hypothetical protein
MSIIKPRLAELLALSLALKLILFQLMIVLYFQLLRLPKLWIQSQPIDQ